MKIRVRSIDKDEELGYTLYKRDLWTQNIDYIINANIYEYDMKGAGLNLIKYYELLDEQTIKYLEELPKYIQNVTIGDMRKADKELNRNLGEAFIKMRKKFFIANDIKEHQILAIKKDAIFLVNKACDKTSFRNVEFVMKHKYTSFHKFSNIEFFYRNSGRVLDIKGINDLKIPPHDEYMCKFLKDIFNLLETSSNDRIISKLKQFSKFYKNKELEHQFYRELNSDCYYSLFTGKEDQIFKSEDYLLGFDIDISYNYINYILPLIQRFFTIKS
jgi:hypothetical protein